MTGVEDEGKRNAWEYYVNEVHEMDKFVAQLIEAVEARNETVSCRILRRSSADAWTGGKGFKEQVSL